LRVKDYNQCVDDYADGVYRFIVKHMRVNDRAKDVVQDAFTKMWEKRSEIQAEKAKSYLFTTAYHCMIDVIRREKKIQYHQDLPQTITPDPINPPDLQELLHLALEQLPEIQKTVVLLRDYEGYSYEEIGEICKLNLSQVKVYIYRARLSMKKFIGKPEVVI